MSKIFNEMRTAAETGACPVKAAFFSLWLGFSAAAILPVSAGAEEGAGPGASLEAHCEARGLRLPEKKWAVLVKGSLTADPREIAGGREHMPAVIEEASKHPGYAVYVPVGLKSELFGQEGGTRLQISFWRAVNTNNQSFDRLGKKKTGLHGVYGYQTLVVNGIPVSAEINMPGQLQPAGSRILLGHDRLDKPALVSAPSKEDLTLSRESPVVLPEGEFLFVYSDCRAKYKAREGASEE